MIHRKRHSGKLWLVVTIADLLVYNLLLVIACLLFPGIYAGSAEVVARLFVSLNIAYLPVAYYFTPVKILTDRVIQSYKIIAAGLKAVSLNGLCFCFLLFLQNIVSLVSPGYFLLFYLFAAIAMIGMWLVLRASLKKYRRSGFNYERVVIVGTNATARKLIANMAREQAAGYRILGNFDITPREGFDGTYLGGIDRLDEYVRKHPVDQIYFTLPGEKKEHIARVMKTADDNFIKFFYVPRISHFVDRNYAFNSIGTSPVLEIHPSPLSESINRIAKRAFDILVSAVAMVLSPLVIIPIGLAVKVTSRGPLFFRQERTGYNGKSFTLYKFRTMRVNSASDTMQATRGDSRVTAVGRFLRRTSLDELPQFYNVLKGDMSVVGPRPHMIAHSRQYSEIIDQYMVRLLIRPGITGWAQVNGFRGETRELWQMEGRVERDVWYIEHWSFLMDITIIFRTVVNALAGERNAY